jgi:hypothetical protein
VRAAADEAPCDLLLARMALPRCSMCDGWVPGCCVGCCGCGGDSVQAMHPSMNSQSDALKHDSNESKTAMHKVLCH